VNGKEVNPSQFARETAYVMQQDVLYAHLTVEETFMMSCLFNTPKSTTQETKFVFLEGCNDTDLDVCGFFNHLPFFYYF